MLITRRAFLLLLGVALLLALATFDTRLVYVALAYLVVIAVLVMVDWRVTPSARDIEMTREHEARLSLGADNLVRVRIQNRGARTLHAIARDEPPIEFGADRLWLTSEAQDASPVNESIPKPHSWRERMRRWLQRAVGSDTQRFVLSPRVPVELHYHVRPPRRGDFAFGDLNLRWWGVLGLVIRQARFPAAGPVKVYPNLLDIRKYELQARKGQLAELGLRQTRMLGSGTEFERLREYQLDDEFRRIDWKATARRGKPVAREFETERSQTVISLLDVGRLMRAPVGALPEEEGPIAPGQVLTKLDYAVNAVLMLSYVAGLRGDRVGLLAFADEVTHYLSPRAGRGQFYRMLALLYAVQSQPVEADYVRAFDYLGARHKRRSLLVLFTDIASGSAADTLVKQIAPLYPRHLPLLVAISDPSVVALANLVPRDSSGVYQRAVAEQLLDERRVILQSLRQRGVLTLDVPANQLTVAVVNRYLELKARGRI